MKYTLVYTREAKNNIEKLDPSIRRLIDKALDTLTLDPFRGKQLSYELAGLRSFRTSDYRIIYRIKKRQILIIVISVGHRKEIYKRLKELLE
jgi:mRNA interferase RelE/StbE